jgi:predicted PurR-regulated permease PerM
MNEGPRPNEPNRASPPWSPATKRLVQTALLLLILLLLYRVRVLLFPLAISLIVAYALNPVIDGLYRNTRLSRNLALALVYLLIIAALVAIPVGTVPRLIDQIILFLQNLPDYLVAVGELLSQPLEIGRLTIPLNELRLEQVYDTISGSIIDIIRSVGSSSVILFGSLASITLSTVGWILVILFISFYMVKDHRQLLESLIQLAPPDHRPDMRQLLQELTILWNDFFRSRIVLCFIVGIITFFLAVLIELPNALVLALIAGIGEFVPNIGPAMASLPAMLVAFLQHESSWLGALAGPFWFAVIVLGIYIFIQQVENTILVPRIIGQSLNMHPMVVFVAALAGASIAGILGILLAAPVLASGRLIFIYLYRKLNDLPPFPTLETGAGEVPSMSALPVTTAESDRR